jgi:hypothetical protein
MIAPDFSEGLSGQLFVRRFIKRQVVLEKTSCSGKYAPVFLMCVIISERF